MKSARQPYSLRVTGHARDGERQRLRTLVRQWLDTVERDRSPFEVIARESKVALTLGPLTLTGVIDRVDRLADGARLVIDYKSNAPPRSAVAPDTRIKEPQLPAYALVSDPPADAIAFGNLGVAKLGLVG